MIKGSGSLITKLDEEGRDIPFLSPEEILKQILKFGFYVKYDQKSNLPMEVITYLSDLYNLGYDKINRITLQQKTKDKSIIRTTRTVVFKTCEETTKILTFGKVISKTALDKMLEDNVLLDVSEECDSQWDWLTFQGNISDILDENIDPTDDYDTETDVKSRDFKPYVPDANVSIPSVAEFTEADLSPEGFTMYVDPEAEEVEDESE